MPSGKTKIVIGFHTFRHSFASNLAVAGVDQRVIDRWMGHTTESMPAALSTPAFRKLCESIRKLSFGGNGDGAQESRAASRRNRHFQKRNGIGRAA